MPTGKFPRSKEYRRKMSESVLNYHHGEKQKSKCYHGNKEDLE